MPQTQTACLAATHCTIPAFGNGIETADSNGCTAETSLFSGGTCDIKLKVGYTDSNSGTATYTCGADGASMTAPTLVTTGCAANFFQSAGTTAATIVW